MGRGKAVKMPDQFGLSGTSARESGIFNDNTWLLFAC